MGKIGWFAAEATILQSAMKIADVSAIGCLCTPPPAALRKRFRICRLDLAGFHVKSPRSHAGKLTSRREVASDGKLYVHGCNTARCSISSIKVRADM